MKKTEYEKLMEQAPGSRPADWRVTIGRWPSLITSCWRATRPNMGWSLSPGSGCKTTQHCGKGTIPIATTLPSETSPPAPGFSPRISYSVTSSLRRYTAASMKHWKATTPLPWSVKNCWPALRSRSNPPSPAWTSWCSGQMSRR